MKQQGPDEWTALDFKCQNGSMTLSLVPESVRELKKVTRYCYYPCPLSHRQTLIDPPMLDADSVGRGSIDIVGVDHDTGLAVEVNFNVRTRRAAF